MTILLFIGALAVLIFSHELGHFLVAKLSKIKVEEFGIGFPPRIFGIKKGETLYSINWIPFGGFVKILGENDNEKTPGTFGSKPAYIRAAVLVAGVFFNVLLAWVLLSGSYVIGAPIAVEDNVAGANVTILEIQSGSPAESVGLMPGDRITSLSVSNQEVEVKNILDVQEFTSKYGGNEITVNFTRGKEEISVMATPVVNPSSGRGALGVALGNIGIVSLPIHKAVWEGAKDTVFLTIMIVKMFGMLIVDIFKGGDMAAQVRGPVGIVGMVGTVAEFGFVYVIHFFALLSVNLAIINLFPFPALDGGRLLFLLIETIKRSPINQKVTVIANNLGFALLVFLLILVTYKDIARLFE